MHAIKPMPITTISPDRRVGVRTGTSVTQRPRATAGGAGAVHSNRGRCRSRGCASASIQTRRQGNALRRARCCRVSARCKALALCLGAWVHTLSTQSAKIARVSCAILPSPPVAEPSHETDLLAGHGPSIDDRQVPQTSPHPNTLPPAAASHRVPLARPADTMRIRHTPKGAEWSWGLASPPRYINRHTPRPISAKTARARPWSSRPGRESILYYRASSHVPFLAPRAMRLAAHSHSSASAPRHAGPHSAQVRLLNLTVLYTAADLQCMLTPDPT